MNKKILLPLIAAFSLFLGGALISFNLYLSILFLTMGFFCQYQNSKKMIKITYGPQGKSPPSNSSTGDIHINY